MSTRSSSLAQKAAIPNAASVNRAKTPAGNRSASRSGTSAPASPANPIAPNPLTTSVAPVEPPTTTVQRKMLTKDAIKELSSRGLIEGSSHPSFGDLVEILLNFTGKETAGEPDFEMVWEVLVAVGTLLKDALGKIVSEATADATFHRFTSIKENAREEARNEILRELEEERKQIEERREIVLSNTLQATSQSQSLQETGAFDVLLARRAEDYTAKTKRLDTLHRAVIDASTLNYIYEQPQEAATHQARIRRRRRRIQNRK
ncbi:hypothetical protein RhiJN_08520 [Ceratobasidium sp. AG-Ba]|nr:hypothetical protein RhiJN_08520 [Ceratobasidium sp. AG-Ba]